jgi:acetyltransferase-like isoleucine patch superfamily enzyme
MLLLVKPIVGANAVVTKSFPANSVLAGNPGLYKKVFHKWKIAP